MLPMQSNPITNFQIVKIFSLKCPSLEKVNVREGLCEYVKAYLVTLAEFVGKNISYIDCNLIMLPLLALATLVDATQI
jgi:hypothetical protein